MQSDLIKGMCSMALINLQKNPLYNLGLSEAVNDRILI